MYNICLAEVGPKKILDLMNVPWLTRENVASHLQVDISLFSFMLIASKLLICRTCTMRHFHSGISLF